MKDKPVIYKGRAVSRVNFRTNVFNPKGEKKLVESWAAYEAAIQSGLWFASRYDAMESVAEVSVPEENKSEESPKPKAKPKSKPKSKPKKMSPVSVLDEDESDVLSDELDDMVYEVTDDK